MVLDSAYDLNVPYTDDLAFRFEAAESALTLMLEVCAADVDQKHDLEPAS